MVPLLVWSKVERMAVENPAQGLAWAKHWWGSKLLKVGPLFPPGFVMVEWLRKPAVKHGEVAHCERSENRGSGGRWLKTWTILRHFHLIGVASVVDFERFWGWCARWQLGDGGVRFPPGPSSDVHLWRLEWRVKWWRNRVKPWKN